VTRQSLWKSGVYCPDAGIRHRQVLVESTRRTVVLARQAQIGLIALIRDPESHSRFAVITSKQISGFASSQSEILRHPLGFSILRA
jgi:hypothetical protein